MSKAVREAIAGAVGAVEGITCSAYYRQNTTTGAASVRYGETTYPNRFGGLVTWEVVVPLPQDAAAAEKFIDEKSPALREALAPVLIVRRVYPARATFDSAVTNVLVIEGQREEDA